MLPQNCVADPPYSHLAPAYLNRILLTHLGSTECRFRLQAQHGFFWKSAKSTPDFKSSGRVAAAFHFSTSSSTSGSFSDSVGGFSGSTSVVFFLLKWLNSGPTRAEAAKEKSSTKAKIARMVNVCCANCGRTQIGAFCLVNSSRQGDCSGQQTAKCSKCSRLYLSVHRGHKNA